MPQTSPDTQSPKKIVLFVDDDPSSRVFIREAVQRRGYETVNRSKKQIQGGDYPHYALATYVLSAFPEDGDFALIESMKGRNRDGILYGLTNFPDNPNDPDFQRVKDQGKRVGVEKVVSMTSLNFNGIANLIEERLRTFQSPNSSSPESSLQP